MARNFSRWTLPLLCAAILTAAEAPSPALLVLNKDEAALAIVDPVARKVIARIPTGEAPHELAVSTDGRLAFASNYGSRTPGNTISVIDLVTQKEMRRVDLGPLRRPHGLAFAGGKLYFTAETNKLIGRYDPAANRIDWLLGTGQNSTHMVLATPDLARLFTANIGSDSVTIIEGDNETVVPVGKGPEGMDLSPDGRELWAANSRDGGVSIVDVAARRVAATLQLATKRSNRLKFTPDGRRVLVSDMGAGDLIVLDAAARKQLRRIPLGRNPEGILIVPDGSRAYVSVAGDNHVAIIDLGSLEVTEKIETGAGPDGLGWVGR